MASDIPKKRSQAAASQKQQQKVSEKIFPFTRENYVLMIIGLIVVAIGYLLMIGGRSPNPNEFHPEEVYSWRRITLAPIVIMIGFALEIYAIMKRPKGEVNSGIQNTKNK
jgi:hypothetical protein